MENQNYIDIATICVSHAVSDTFIIALHDIELIQIEEIDNIKFIALDQLDIVEKFIRLHTDLDINPEGIDVIYNLTRKILTLQDEIFLLKKRLDIYESDD